MGIIVASRRHKPASFRDSEDTIISSILGSVQRLREHLRTAELDESEVITGVLFANRPPKQRSHACAMSIIVPQCRFRHIQ